MNHQKIYDQLIERARVRDLKRTDCYVEMHHVIPKALGGSDDASNLVALTAREHYIAHLLLGHIHGGNMWAPIRFFNKSLCTKNSRYYEIAKNKQTFTDETRIKMSDAKRGKPRTFKPGWVNPLKGVPRAELGYYVSDETRAKQRAAKLGKKLSEEHKAKIGAAARGKKMPREAVQRRADMLRGKPRSDEVKATLREAFFNTPNKICEHCGKSVKPAPYKRWHGDNCKMRIKG